MGVEKFDKIEKLLGGFVAAGMHAHLINSGCAHKKGRFCGASLEDVNLITETTFIVNLRVNSGETPTLTLA